MAQEAPRVIDRQVISEKPGSIEAIAGITNPIERRIAILDRKIRAKLMRTQLAAMGQGPTGWSMLETDVANTRARIEERAMKPISLQPLPTQDKATRIVA